MATDLAKIKAEQRVYLETESLSAVKISKTQSLSISPQQPPESLINTTHMSNDVLPDKTPREDNIKSTSTPYEVGNSGGKNSPSLNPTVNDTLLDPNVAEWKPKCQHCPKESSVNQNMESTENAVSRMADLQQLQQQQNKQVQELLKQQREQTVALTLPQPDLPVFSGDPIEYCNFIKAFETLIESKTSSNSSRLFYLIQYTEGDVKELMRSCLSMSPQEGYQTARQLLKSKYGQNYRIASAYVDKITKMSPIKAEDGTALQRYSVMLISCKNTLKEIGFLNKIENPDALQRIIEKLPFNLRQRWRDVADDITEVKGREVTIGDIAKFVETKARAANHPIFGTIVYDTKNHDFPKAKRTTERTTPTRKVSTYSTQAATSTSSPKADNEFANSTPRAKCHMCVGDHWLARCDAFKGKSVEERQKFVREKGLCDNCLQTGHLSKTFPKDNFCKVSDCKIVYRKHSTFLHPPGNGSTTFKREQPTIANATNDSSAKVNCSSSKNNYVNVADGLCTATGAGTIRTALSVVPVKVKAKGKDTVIETYAFLDSGSNTSFCTEHLINRLGISGKETTLSLTTMDNENVKSKSKVVSLVVCDLDEKNTVELSNVYTRTKLPVSNEDIPRQDDVNQWPHLQGIALTRINADIELLIGNDVPLALEPQEVKRSCNGGPYAVKTRLGWTVNGPLKKSVNTTCKVNRIHSDVELNVQFEHFCDREFNDTRDNINKAMSQEDVRALQVMEETAKLVNGHYEVALPWRVYPPNLSNNKVLAERRLAMLKKRLTKDEELHRKYSEFMQTLSGKGYAQKVPEDQLNRTELPAWYLPHHPVIHPHKPGKVRVVFDCAAKFQGTSINERLMQGPDFTNTLVGVMTRFRKEQTAVMADIKSMFYQVHVSPKDRTYLRYLWWPDGDLNKTPQEHQMLVHLFGGISSPSCASFGLRKTAKDNEQDFDKETVKTVNENFYVDDCLTSVENESKAIHLVDQLRKLLSKGGFRLTKWISNSRNVIESVPESERASSVKDLDLDRLPMERALGILWNVETDMFCFKTTIKDSPLTRRGVLSVISSVYDPLGFVSPFLLPAKELLQDLCRRGLDWDDQLPQEDRDKWRAWLEQLPHLQHFTVDRCLKPKNFGEGVSTQLHNFADASQKGYGAVSYLRVVNSKGEIHCTFLMRKSRLAPMKAVTIPRLELSAAVVATRLGNMINQELDIDIDETFYWTDSTCVLGYILNQEKRFHVFVANRIA
ncbi:MAG: hypothetical protein DSY43_04230, partial [Gammaproteobacteria bacterium]